MYRYHAYGLCLHSELEIPEFLECENAKPDVSITFGNIDDQLGRDVQCGPNCQGLPGLITTTTPKIGRFSARDGNQIIIDRETGASDNQLRIMITGTMIAAVLQQRRFLPLQASCSKGPNGAILFVGSTATGKSTLLSAMTKRGYPMIADGISALFQGNDGAIAVVPAAPTIKIWPDAAEVLKLDCSQAWEVRNALEVLHVPVDSFASEATPISKVVLLHHASHGGYSVEPLGLPDAFLALRNLVYRRHFFGLMGMNAFQFSFMSDLVSQIPVYRLTRPTNEFEPYRMAEFVESKFDLLQDNKC